MPPTVTTVELDSGDAVPPDAVVKELMLKLDSAVVLHNKKLFGSASVYVVGVVVDDANPAQQPLQPPAVFTGIGDGEPLPISQGGLLLYRSAPDRPPGVVEYRIEIRRTTQSARELGAAIPKLLQDPAYQRVATQLKDAASSTGNPYAGLIGSLADDVFSLVGSALRTSRDHQILTCAGTFDKSNGWGGNQTTTFPTDDAEITFHTYLETA